jgi:hypothetical protein
VSERGGTTGYVVFLPQRPPAAAARFPKLIDPVHYERVGEALARNLGRKTVLGDRLRTMADGRSPSYESRTRVESRPAAADASSEPQP